MRHLIVVLSLLAMAIAGCAGKSNVSLVDREKQAFDDLRAEIRSAINDEEREVKAIALVEELAEELKSLRRKRTERRKMAGNYIQIMTRPGLNSMHLSTRRTSRFV